MFIHGKELFFIDFTWIWIFKKIINSHGWKENLGVEGKTIFGCKYYFLFSDLFFKW